jgi:hypothetical protein
VSARTKNALAPIWRAVVVSAVVVNAVAYAGARQQSPAPRATEDDGQARAEHAVVESMSGHQMHMGSPHLRLTAAWPEQPGDRERAATIVKALRAALERYRDYRVAERNGYEIFHPEVPQPIYHFTNYAEGFAETFRFTPDQATSLLYRKTAVGYELEGAMYTASRNESEIDLNARVPLSVARWHAHINICLPPRGLASSADWKKFGPDGSISTADACAAAKGRFFPQLFGWMVHVYPFEKTPEKIWG